MVSRAKLDAEEVPVRKATPIRPERKPNPPGTSALTDIEQRFNVKHHSRSDVREEVNCREQWQGVGDHVDEDRGDGVGIRRCGQDG